MLLRFTFVFGAGSGGEMPNHSQPRYVTREDWVCHIFETRKPIMAHVMGIPYQIELEDSPFPDRVDHVWITVQVPPCGTVLISVNTISRLSRLAGFDPRVRVGVVSGKWTEKPEAFLDEHEGLNYREFEAEHKIDYQPYEHDPISELLVARGKAAIRIEAWGELYRRDHLGMHQIHSRRASSAVRQDVVGKDGAIQFYLPDGTREMYFFKYSGQR